MCGIGGYCGGWGGVGVAEVVGGGCFIGGLICYRLCLLALPYGRASQRQTRAFCIGGERKTSERSVASFAHREREGLCPSQKTPRQRSASALSTPSQPNNP